MSYKNDGGCLVKLMITRESDNSGSSEVTDNLYCSSGPYTTNTSAALYCQNSELYIVCQKYQQMELLIVIIFRLTILKQI